MEVSRVEECKSLWGLMLSQQILCLECSKVIKEEIETLEVPKKKVHEYQVVVKQSFCSECLKQIAQIIGRVYFLANPLSNPSELVEYIQQNRTYFVEDCTVIRYTKSLGNRLVSRGLSSLSQEDYDGAYESTLGMGGTMEQARDVANSISSGSMNLYMLGNELLWLAEVLPYAVNGNWRPFQTTGTNTRNQIRQILPFYNMMLKTEPLMLQLVDEIMKQYNNIITN